MVALAFKTKMLVLAVHTIIAYISLSSLVTEGIADGQSSVAANDFFGGLLGDNNLSDRRAMGGKSNAKGQKATGKSSVKNGKNAKNGKVAKGKTSEPENEVFNRCRPDIANQPCILMCVQGWYYNYKNNECEYNGVCGSACGAFEKYHQCTFLCQRNQGCGYEADDKPCPYICHQGWEYVREKNECKWTDCGGCGLLETYEACRKCTIFGPAYKDDEDYYYDAKKMEKNKEEEDEEDDDEEDKDEEEEEEEEEKDTDLANRMVGSNVGSGGKKKLTCNCRVN